MKREDLEYRLEDPEDNKLFYNNKNCRNKKTKIFFIILIIIIINGIIIFIVKEKKMIKRIIIYLKIYQLLKIKKWEILLKKEVKIIIQY